MPIVYATTLCTVTSNHQIVAVCLNTVKSTHTHTRKSIWTITYHQLMKLMILIPVADETFQFTSNYYFDLLFGNVKLNFRIHIDRCPHKNWKTIYDEGIDFFILNRNRWNKTPNKVNKPNKPTKEKTISMYWDWQVASDWLTASGECEYHDGTLYDYELTAQFRLKWWKTEKQFVG